MTNKRIEFHEAAAEEYLAAFDWYFERSEEAAAGLPLNSNKLLPLFLKRRSAGP